MKRRGFLNLSCAPILARAVFVLAPMVAFAGSGLWEAPDRSDFGGDTSRSFANASTASRLQLAMISKSVKTLPLAPAPATAVPTKAAELRVNGTALQHIDETTTPRPIGTLRSRSLGSDSFVVESSAPDDLFFPAAEESIESLSVKAMVPVLDPTTALFGMALVGFSALARYGPRANPEATEAI
jgi:hypothetical protein